MSILKHAQGCLVGQFAGDTLGGLVEFKSKRWIENNYPDGVREMADGGTWKTIAGQLTDDSEMACALTDSLIRNKTFVEDDVKQGYVDWMESRPFDIGYTTTTGLNGRRNFESQANGGLMRISPLGIFGVNHPQDEVGMWAYKDANITHPHPICLEASMLFAIGIREAILKPDAQHVYDTIVKFIDAMPGRRLEDVIELAKTERPKDYVTQQGWVLIAFQNALYQLLNADSFEEGIIDTIQQGGDTDTNAAIAGALLGAVHGIENIPNRWVETLVKCEPDENSLVPRPKLYWPNKVLELAEKLIEK